MGLVVLLKGGVPIRIMSPTNLGPFDFVFSSTRVDLRSMVGLLLHERWIHLADESDGGTQGCMVGAWNCEALDLQV